jgi:acyl-CoA thioester hydrolase
MLPHLFPIRVYYEDTDAGGIVYHANYLNFAERARTEALRDAGINQSLLWQSHGVGFVVRKAVVDYSRPARLDDLLSVETHLEKWGRASLTLLQTIKRGDETLANVHIKLAVIDRDFRLVEVSDELKQLMGRVFG